MASPRTTWSDLPMDILQIVCNKLNTIQDFVAFGAMCSHWRNALWLCHKHIPPLLMLPNYEDKGNNAVFCLPDFHKTILHSKPLASCLGSSHGWLVTEECSEIKLINPFIASNNVIQLPPLGKSLVKGVISDDPLRTSDYTVMVIDINYKLACLKPGETSWTQIHCGCEGYGENEFYDIAYYESQLYATSKSGTVLACDLTTTQPKLKTIFSSHRFCRNLFLVELLGDLLCVEKKIVYKNHGWDIDRFHVFKVQTRSGSLEELENLGGHTLFISGNNSVSVSASDFLNCKPDHIYFSFEGILSYPPAGAFSLNDASIQCYQIEKYNRTPIWIQPTLGMVARNITPLNHKRKSSSSQGMGTSSRLKRRNGLLESPSPSSSSSSCYSALKALA